MGKAKLVIVALLIGITNALIFKGFEFIVNHGTNYIWNTAFKTNTHRWGVVPLAIVLGIGLALLIRLLHQKHLVKPKLSPTDSEDPEPPATLASIGIITLIGIGSLLAGASLGPEASLVAIATTLGLWTANQTKLGKAAELVALSSVGALLVAFFGSIVPLLIPTLMLWKKKRLTILSAAPVVFAGVSSFITLWAMNHSVIGYGDIPIGPDFKLEDLFLAVVLGICAAGLGWLLKKSITAFHETAQKWDAKLPWVISAAIFGLGIGILYLIGGQSVQFSGNEGSGLIIHHVPAYGLWMLIIILAAKLLVTGWSLATGYRGGLVFPSIYIGVVIALIAHSLFGSAGPGIMIGSIAGVLGSMTGSAIGLIFIASIIPAKLAGVAIAGIIGGTIGNKLIAKISTTHKVSN